jgi:hypothetical protein
MQKLITKQLLRKIQTRFLLSGSFRGFVPSDGISLIFSAKDEAKDVPEAQKF